MSSWDERPPEPPPPTPGLGLGEVLSPEARAMVLAEFRREIVAQPVKVRWRFRLKWWLYRRRETPELRRIREQFDEELVRELLYGRKDG